MKMFCYQCQEALKNTGCTTIGVCGKTADVANLQDLLIFTLKGISFLNLKAREVGVNKEKTDRFLIEGLFSTITNVNFDRNFFLRKIKEAVALRDEIKEDLRNKGVRVDEYKNIDAISWTYGTDADIEAISQEVGVLSTEDEDIRSLRELITYGVKGMAAYAYHAYQLGYKDDNIFKFMEKALAKVLDDSLTVDDYVALAMETGKYGVDTMALLDKANTSTYGHPEITKVNIGVRNNPGILVSGHDLKDLEQLLEQTAGTGVDVYTHGEMLPAHYYPAFKKYPHFVGNYGNAWWQQDKEFELFNGPILMTTNCLIPPKDSYKDRVYTTGVVGFEGVKYIPEGPDGKKDFSEIIEHAKRCKPPVEIERGEIIGGFAHNQVLQLADKIVEAVKTGAIKRFFVMAGCDGRMKSRTYYTEFAKALPKDTVILTAGCAKYRYNKLNLGDIDGIPRVLDAGQCNDSYSLAVIAMKLKEIFGLNDINELPISYNIAWYEQKAVIVLLALLYLGVKNIHLGPTLPAFLSPNVTKVLVEKFGIGGITNVEDDLKMFLGA
ncbi:hydroxylamine reductase [Caldanaerobacter subterraneus subsp. tengcongensis MB4]|uniref:Hydroxylamine reductase n=1 Tax=Caldanaerobacter subterraneus subsp. tengcongensis (strain DSM 15242 / JCM 11007 / NBRC 100824 / MB4) TaxID=273068 RepID=HCP_CALS4|nr:hydroxylamine reductase [Caldanaerobacter subterraneus]Q8R6M9.1 RecName: Full=Hydroxylamine reductase; AltName: Full=Hybrid-cluster protein; Short=HCP; AltName: Full=Prismane protein [Caldanaerobacter subterraneus subsp. tengcongensis MB4]AAM25876.1 6Fe-6S prismane cluster-containing protein [Caldanaerobacter subterraneus subsp. tengcongensis MB4]MCS3917239.1 hydroxylamine reductase [Caldanaerobacter subterraneus subsp. tengcongensis MB4]